MSLKLYQRKRNFKKTTEPKGKLLKKKLKHHPLIFVVQKHAARHLHYDFRLELNGVLISWAVPKGPSLDPNIKRLAMHVEDHPIEYGSFEGIIPKGQYGGGTVMLWDEGVWISQDENPKKAYTNGNMTFTLQGKKLNGSWKLIRMKRDDKTWLLFKIKDKYAKPIDKFDIIKKAPNSIKTQLSIDEIAEHYDKIWNENIEIKVKKLKIKKIKLSLKPKAFPEKILPQLTTLVDKPPDGKEWLHEIKFDGYRIVALKHDNVTRLITRRQHDWTSKFNSIAKEINSLSIKNIILDGEVVALDQNQRSNFQLLQNSIKDSKHQPLIYYVFDLLYFDKYNLMNLSLSKRKDILQQIIPADSPILRFSDHIVGSGHKIYKEVCKQGLEGIISKNVNSTYVQKRERSWLKIKCLKRQEFVIGGFTKGKGHRHFFGALLIGAFNKRNELIYHGRVGTGFTEATLKNLYQLLIKKIQKNSPFKHLPPDSKEVKWVDPLLIAEIEFAEWTKDNILREPSFKGLRNDKSTKAITKELETPIENIVNNKQEKMSDKKSKFMKLTNPHKILYPEDKITKLALMEYYEEIEPYILPYLINRPLTLVRCPNHYQKCFYQKHIDKSAPSSLLEITIKEKQKKETYIYINDQEGLLALPQLGTLEIHPWGSKIESVEYPDMIIFDLDPAEDVPWKQTVKTAIEIKKQLSQLKLQSFVKTTGGKGLHIVLPIKPEYEWDEVKNFSRVFAKFITLLNPKEHLTKMAKSERKGKIYIDYLRNQRGATAVAPYSTRAKIHAPVATPVDWDELTHNFNDTFYTMKTIKNRLQSLKKDPWKDFFKLKQSLNLDKFKK